MISDYFYDTNKKHSEDEKIEFSRKRIDELKEYIVSKLFKPVEDLVAPPGTYIPVSVETSPEVSLNDQIKASHPKHVWTVYSIKNFIDPTADRFYINSNYFERFTSEWTQKTKVKLERIDWLYLIYQVVIAGSSDNPPYNVGWADGTLGIHMDQPPICK